MLAWGKILWFAESSVKTEVVSMFASLNLLFSPSTNCLNFFFFQICFGDMVTVQLRLTSNSCSSYPLNARITGVCYHACALTALVNKVKE